MRLYPRADPGACKCPLPTHSGLPSKNSSMSASEEKADEQPDGDSKPLHFGQRLLRQPRLAQTVDDSVRTRMRPVWADRARNGVGREIRLSSSYFGEHFAGLINPI